MPPIHPPLPGPRWPRVVQTLLGLFAPYWTRRRAYARYGRVFQTNDAIVGPLVHVADRELVEQMFKWKPDAYSVGEPREKIMEPALGRTSILLLDGDRHLRMRRLMLPPFHGEAIARYRDEIAAITDREIDAWQPGQTVRTRALAQAVTLEAIIRIVFGITDAERVAELKHLLPRFTGFNPLAIVARRDFGPLRVWQRFLDLRGRIDEILLAEIAHRRAGGGDERHDILQLLLSATDEDGRPLSDTELRDELVTILGAGYETTATSIGWAFERLVRTPAALDRLTAEVRDATDGPYLDAVVKETLRIRPVVTEVFRMPTRPVELGGHRFEAGTQLCAAMYLVQCDPQVYGPDPLEFRPERFLGGAPEPYAWVPFGGGVRRCLGAAFAELEMRVVIARVVERATLRAPRKRAELPRFAGITILPSRGGEAVVERVSPGGPAPATAARDHPAAAGSPHPV